MPIAPGSVLGPYQVLAPLGAGGMGEVYRARDSRLNREVAVKVLAPHLAADAGALARFEREAQAVAALSHPNILAIHDVGRADDTAYAVMELLDGATLRARLADGPLPVRKALDCAQHIATGLAAAHARGIVHRDLKPENIFMTADGRVKILDFGLAQVAAAAAAPGGHEQTMLAAPASGTSPGTVLGTFGYMAPEQVRGQALDARADIFAFGAVLYEMLTGRRAFAGETPADTMSAILRSDPPDMTSLNASLPPALDRIVRRCLEKEPAERFHSARDLAFALEALSTGSGTASSGMGTASAPIPEARASRGGARVLLWASIAALLGLAVGAIASRAAGGGGPATMAPGVVRFVVPSLIGFPPGVAVSPDGRSIVWQALNSAAAETGTRANLFVRDLSSDEVRVIPESNGGVFPLWAPDGRRVGFLRDDSLFVTDLSGASQRYELPRLDVPIGRSMSWHAVGGILLGAGNKIWLLDPAQPSTAARVVSAPGEGELAHGWPEWFPDGRRFLFLVDRKDAPRELRVGSIDGGPASTIPLPGQTTRVLLDPAGFLLYGQNGALVAHPFDIGAAALRGSPSTVVPDVDWGPNGWLAASVSATGVLAFRAIGVTKVQFEWVDRVGRRLGSVGVPDAYTNFDLGPGARQVVAVRRTPDVNTIAIALIDLERDQVGEAVEATSRGYSDPTFSPDGSQMAYRRGRQIVSQPVNGGEVRVLADWIGYPDSWSRDGRYLAVGRPAGRNYELWAVALDGSADIPLVQGQLLADEPRFSPDGKWVVYHAAQGDRPQVFAMPFPPTGERFQISSNGGVQPRWRADGRELFFLGADGAMMAVAVPDGRASRAGRPVALFNTALTASAAFDQFAPSPDGQRFLIRRPLGGQTLDTAPVTVILNWTQLESVRAGR